MPEEAKETTEQENTESVVENEEKTEEKVENEEKMEEKVETKEAPKEELADSKDIPVKYDLKLSENSDLDASDIERISAYAKEKGLSNEAAQELVTQEESAISSYKDAQMEEVEATRAKWLEDSENDKEFGGEDFKKNIELAKRVINRFGSDTFKETLDSTGFGNHPEVVRLFVKIGKAMSEDTLVHGKAPGKPKKDIKDILFDKTANQ